MRPGGPALIAGGAAAGGITADKLATAWDQLERLYDRATEGGEETSVYALRASTSGSYPTVRGGMVYLNEGDVWKYGITNDTFERYSLSTLNSLSLNMDVLYTGSRSQAYVAEKVKLIEYVYEKKSLPPGNKIFK